MQTQVMKEAWTLYRSSRNPALAFDRSWFRRSLRIAWGNVKLRKWQEGRTEADRIRDARNMLQNKDRWTDADYAEDTRLCAELRAAA